MRPSALTALACLAAGLVTARSGESVGWELRRAAQAGSGKPDCTLTPRARSRIEVGRDRLAVKGLPRQSLFNYQYRIDDRPASTPTVPTAAMQEAGAITLEGPAFDAVLGAKRFAIRVLDRWHEAITEDIDLTGLADLHRTLVETCK